MKSIRTKAITIVITVIFGLMITGNACVRAEANSTYSANQTSKTNNNLKSKKTIIIKCYGDSVTGGVGMPDNRTAVFGGSTYPSALLTLLTENGVNAVVENCGNGGEKSSAITSRLGGAKIYVGEDLTFNSEGCTGTINDKLIGDFGSGIMVPLTYVNTEKDFNPVTINGRQYEAKIINNGDGTQKNLLYKKADDSTLTIHAGTMVNISSNAKNSINIICCGICDDSSITIDKYVSMLKNAASVSGNYIILGPHSAQYNKPLFVDGKTPEERRENYLKRMRKEFGDHFIDLNTEWYLRALPLVLEKGYFSDLTNEQVNVIQNKLNNRIIPAEFTYSHKDNNVHLNKEGYLVIAQIVYERLKLLGYI